MITVDMRVRPPISAFLHAKNMTLFAPENLNTWNKFTGSTPSPSALQGSLELLLKEMKQANIDKGMVHGRKNSNIENDAIAELVLQYPNTFIGSASLNPNEGLEACLKELDTYVINGPLSGIFLEPLFDWPNWNILDEKTMFPIYEKCSEHNIPALFTLGGFSYTTKNRMNTLPAIETLAFEFPNLKIALCHGAWPAIGDAVSMAVLHNNIFISPDMYMVRIPGWEDYMNAANNIIPDRLMYGSAYPACSLSNAKNFFLNCGIHQDVLPLVMGGNALTLFNGEKVSR